MRFDVWLRIAQGVRVAVLAWAAVFAWESGAVAEPTPAVRWLMSEPASMFDIGMMRLRELSRVVWMPELQARVRSGGLPVRSSGGGLGSAVYDLEKNEINVNASFVGEPSEALCSRLLGMFKDTVIPERNRSQARPYTAEFLTHVFDHVNYSTSRRPEDLAINVAQVIVFTVNLSQRDRAERWEGDSIFCSSRVFDDTPSFKKFPAMLSPTKPR